LLQEPHLPEFEAQELDVFARAFDRALQAAPVNGYDPEEKKAILMTGIMDAARRGVRDETILAEAALAALALYDSDEMDAVMRQTPL
jgi:hypothetical protein